MSLCEYCDLYGFTTNLWRGWWRRGCGGLGLLGVGRLLEVLVAILAHLDPLGHVAHSRVLCETKNNLFLEKTKRVKNSDIVDLVAKTKISKKQKNSIYVNVRTKNKVKSKNNDVVFVTTRIVLIIFQDSGSH